MACRITADNLVRGPGRAVRQASHRPGTAGQADPVHVQRLVAETRATHTSRGTPPNATTVQHVYKLVRNALADAYRMEMVTRNVAAQVKARPTAPSESAIVSLAQGSRGGLSALVSVQINRVCAMSGPLAAS